MQACEIYRRISHVHGKLNLDDVIGKAQEFNDINKTSPLLSVRCDIPQSAAKQIYKKVNSELIGGYN